MALHPDSPTAQKAGYILLTSASYHADNYAAFKLICDVRSSLSQDMSIHTLVESIELIETLVYPRFSANL